jgi:transcriptional regulator with PAS, ATPase and Fis domain
MNDTTPGGTVLEQLDGIDAAPSELAYLFVVFECDRPLAGGMRIALEELDEVVIRRGSTRQLARVGRRLELKLPSTLLSSSHARLLRTQTGWSVEDLGSRNGTFLNLKKLATETLSDGDFVELGRVVLRFRTMSGEMADSPPGPLGFTTLIPSLAVAMRELTKMAASSLPILLLGETGTGKEVLARGVHELSGRSGPLITVNCGALSGTLLDSQLFGHVRGAFTGALRDELGFVRAADGGTLFLDEIGDLPLPAQVALLRVIQEREVVPVGATKPVKVDLRIIAATHRQLDFSRARGEFRDDLYSRLAGHIHYLAPLRERREDLGMLVASLLAGEAPRFSADAGRALVTNDWPLNVRQLEQSLARAVMLAEDGVIHARHLHSQPTQAAPTAPATDRDRSPGEAELRALLERTGGNISEAARSLGCSRIQVHRWMQRYGLERDKFRT